MAITGVFVSDFTDFIRGTKDAEKSLGALLKQGTDFGTAWDAMLKEANFEDLINRPLSTSVGLAKDFALALGPIGKAAVIAGAGLTAMGTALAIAALETSETVANLGDLAEKSNISVPAMSRLSMAAEVAGSDIGLVAGAIYEMQKRMAQSPQEFERGLQGINLTLQEFKTLEPEKQFWAIVEGLKAQEDPLKRIGAGNDLIGRQYRELGPVLSDLAAAQELVKGSRPFTKEDAENAEALQMQWAALKLELKGITQEMGTTVTPVFTTFVETVRDAGPVVSAFWDKVRREAIESKTWIELIFSGGVQVVAPAIEDLERKMNALRATTLSAGQLAVPTFADAMAHSREMALLNAESLAENTRLEKEAAAEWARIVAEEKKLTEDKFKRELDLHKLLQAELAKTTAARLAHVNEAVLREFDAQTQLNQAMGLDATGAIKMQESALTTYEAKIKAINALKLEGISTTQQEALAAFQLQQDLLAEARATDQVIASTNQVPAAAAGAIQGFKQMGLASQEAARYFQELKGTIDNAVQTANTLASWDAQKGIGGQLGASNVVQVGRNLFSKETGEYLGELEAKYGAGGFLGYGVRGKLAEERVANVNIYGSVLGTPEAIARVVGGALTNSYSSGGNRLPI